MDTQACWQTLAAIKPHADGAARQLQATPLFPTPTSPSELSPKGVAHHQERYVHVLGPLQDLVSLLRVGGWASGWGSSEHLTCTTPSAARSTMPPAAHTSQPLHPTHHPPGSLTISTISRSATITSLP